MATAKKAAPKKAPAKKAVAKPAPKKDLVIDGPVVLNKKQEQTIVMIQKNQERIIKDAVHMMDIAFDSGTRLLELKDQIKAKFKLGWKEWAETAGNLPISYSQVTRYMGLAKDKEMFEKIKAMGVTSIEDGLKQIKYIEKPELQAADEAKAEAKAAAPKAAPKATAVTISYAFDVVSALDLDELRQMQDFISERIDELTEAANADVIEGSAEEVEDDDTDEVVAEIVGSVDPLS